ncbi:glutathione S-transferase family protein [Ramlibacter sp. AW1]|uniref:Glutathione S-transferase family protein n=1 Tax=Ramlibacter aurantiacus TaxID=2801330 RepID=A0A936ZQ77_9BURK|nr:glutathione S-transferase [Ramlibacter aurantiacus]MBL0421555.1 glutathione S-transferase family protein [Ramlibacter aurantiacus]
MTAPSLESLVADARNALGTPADRIGPRTDAAPRFELFNGPNSICSQKVRAVLAQHQIPYLSHSMDMFAGQTYLPPYVRLRMHGCDSLGGPLMEVHTGSTSVSHGGCDPAVVPTLVDWQTRQVIVDSKRICLYLDAEIEPSRQLRPRHLEDLIDAQLGIVDNLPNYQMLGGKPPGIDTRPASQHGKTGIELARGKVARCERYLAEYPDDPTMVRAYSAKRAKELTAAERLFGVDAMRAAYDKAESACADLEQLLRGRSTEWLLDDRFTMADLYWAIELLRMQNLGAQSFWTNGKRPAVASFAERVRSLPPLRSAILDWPGANF